MRTMPDEACLIAIGRSTATLRSPLSFYAARKRNDMKSDIEKKVDGRVAAAFEDIIPGPGTEGGQEILRSAQELVRAVWVGKIYAALPKDKTTTAEYFLDAELEQFLNEAVEECHQQISLLAQRVQEEFDP